MADTDIAPTGLRDSKKQDVRDRITDEMTRLLNEGCIDITHDLIAERTGISRRTVYRYYPDKETLFDSVIERVRVLAGKNVIMPRDEADLTGTLHDIYTGFDRIAALTTLVRSTPQGRALRRAANKQRVASYSAAMADAVKDLPEGDQTLATAIVQVLHTTPWLEMRVNWGLCGDQMARAAGWAIRTFLKDLRAREGRPLDSEP